MCSVVNAVVVVVAAVAAVAAHKEMKKSNIDSTLKSRSCNRVRGGLHFGRLQLKNSGRKRRIPYLG